MHYHPGDTIDPIKAAKASIKFHAGSAPGAVRREMIA